MIAVLDASAAVRQVGDPSGAPEIFNLVGQAELVLARELFVAWPQHWNWWTISSHSNP